MKPVSIEVDWDIYDITERAVWEQTLIDEDVWRHVAYNSSAPIDFEIRQVVHEAGL